MSDDIQVIVDCGEPVEASELCVCADDLALEQSGPPGASVFEVWRLRPGNQDKTPDDFLAWVRDGAKATFETVSKNLDADSGQLIKDGGQLVEIRYSTPDGEVVKTFSRTDGKLTSITLSGPGVPAGIKVTKTINWTSGGISSFSYS